MNQAYHNIYSQTSPKKSKLKSLFATFIYYLSLFLLTFSDYFNAGLSLTERNQVKVTIISGNSLAWIIVVVTAYVVDRNFHRLIFGKIGILYGLIISFYIFLGWLNGNLSTLLGEVLFWIWLPGGLAMFRVIANSFQPKVQLFSLLLVSSFLMFKMFTGSIADNMWDKIGEETRVYDLGGGKYSALIFIITAILLNLFRKRDRFLYFLVWLLVCLNAYTLLFVGSSRSGAIVLFFVIFFSFLGADDKIVKRIMTNKFFFSKKWLIRLIFIGIIVTSSLILYPNFYENLASSINKLYVFQRLFNPDDSSNLSSFMRILDAEEAIKQVVDDSIVSIFLGLGLGAKYWSSTGGMVNAVHIGVLTFFLKGGLILFSFIFYNLYIKFPKLFFLSLIKSKTLDPLKRNALLIVLPGVFGWSTLLMISGGIQPLTLMGLGIAFGVYLEIKKNGLSLFLR